jgi:hypothetical protein
MARDKMKSWFAPATHEKTRESPNDFMLAFLKWKQANPERNLTPKGFAIIREEQKNSAHRRTKE